MGNFQIAGRGVDSLTLSWAGFTTYPILQVSLAVSAIAIGAVAATEGQDPSARSYAHLVTDFDRAPIERELERVVPPITLAPATAVAHGPKNLFAYVPGIYYAGAAIAEPPSR